MILVVQRWAEKRHDLIADQFVQSSIITKDCPRREFVEAVELRGNRGRTRPLGKRRETPDVDEQDREDSQFPTLESELVSKSTEIGILPRWADLQQSEGHGTYP